VINSLNSNISFEGLKENLRLGEGVYKNFKKDFPVVRSNTFVDAKISEHLGSDKFKKLIPKLKHLEYKYGNGVSTERKQRRGNNFSIPEYINNLRNVLAEKKYANCGEQAQIIQYQLFQKGEKPHIISMLFKYECLGVNMNDHTFTVFGLKKGAELDNPKTWGNHAVVVDPWANIVMKSSDAIEYFKTKFLFKPERHVIQYELSDLINVE